MKYSQQEIDEARKNILRHVRPGDTIYTILRHRSRSGMMRRISPVFIDREGNTFHFDHAAAVLLGLPKTGGGDGIKMNGCGMDMGFHLVYELSHALFPKGAGCIGEGCPSNDHSNGDRDFTPHKVEGLKPYADHWHRDGGYMLRHRWL